jgi:hypothetical protein
VLVVQLACMAYQAYLLQRCNMAHMRLFSVFLALPSATVRIMATQQMQVGRGEGGGGYGTVLLITACR